MDIIFENLKRLYKSYSFPLKMEYRCMPATKVQENITNFSISYSIQIFV